MCPLWVRRPVPQPRRRFLRRLRRHRSLISGSRCRGRCTRSRSTTFPRRLRRAPPAPAPTIVARPADAWPKVPHGFKVWLYADGLATPRVIHVAPNGDVFVAESGGGQIRVFHGLTADGKPERTEVF